MKSHRSILVVVLATLALSWPGTLLAQDNLVVKARVTDWKPAFWQEGDRWIGMDMEFYQALEEAADLSFVYHKMPWARGIYEMKQGTCTLMSQISITAERQSFMHFVGPYNHEEIVLVVHKDDVDLPITSLDDLVTVAAKRKKKIGIIRDAWYGAAFAQKMETDPAFRRSFEYARPTIVRMLAHKRVLGMVFQRVIMAYRIRNVPEYKNLAIHDFVLNSDAIYFGVSKQAPPEVVEKVKTAAEGLLADGTFRTIETRWKQH